MFFRSLVLTLFLTSSPVLAELDPALADLSTDKLNPGGLFIKGGLGFGQSDPAGESSPGVGYNLGGELGYGFSSGYWKRMEVGMGLETGSLAYKSKSGGASASVTLTVPLAMMLRFSMGSVMGRGGILLWNVGVGAYLVDYQQKYLGSTFKSSSAEPSVAWRLGATYLMPFSEVLQFEGGIQHTQVTVNVDELKSGSTTVNNADVSDIVNIPQITIGFRLSMGD